MPVFNGRGRVAQDDAEHPARARWLARGKRLLVERVEADASSGFLYPTDLQRTPVPGRAVGAWEWGEHRANLPSVGIKGCPYL